MKWAFLCALLMVGSLQADDRADRESICQDINYLESFEFQGEGGVIITQGDRNQLILEGDKECLKNIKVSIDDNGKLLIVNKTGLLHKGCTDFTCQLIVKEIREITLDGNIYLKTNQLEVHRLYLTLYGDCFGDIKVNGGDLVVLMEGNGKLIAEGTIGDQEVDLKGSAFYHADDLISLNATIKIIGSGRANVVVEKYMEIVIKGDGKIYYCGEPKEIWQNIMGSGQLIKRIGPSKELPSIPLIP